MTLRPVLGIWKKPPHKLGARERFNGIQYYYRLLQSQRKDLVEKEMLETTAPSQVSDRLEFVKNPVVAEFLGLESRSEFTENTLEGAIITNLQKFLMELGKGFAFVARQQHIHTEKQDYYIDLVFYNYILKCLPHRLENIPREASRCRADGYVCADV